MGKYHSGILRTLGASAIIIGLLNGITPATASGMATPVGFNVTETGAATFNIPIAVPPGTAGIAPSLSLNYNSQGGNGMLGMGWSLGGLSAIYRCGRTLIQDGVKDGVNYNSNDKYCLDGQRLVAVSGAYGANGTEYRTERESFTKVISYGTAGSGPAYFKAWTKAGQIIEFGNTADSAIEAQGKTDIRIWASNKISDTKGNYLTVSYTEDNPNGDYRPDRIDYTGNAGANPVLTPYNSVRFAYEDRADATPMYDGGSLIKSTKRLTNVQTYAKVGAADILVKDYRLTYTPSSNVRPARLITLTGCVVTTDCLTSTQISWLVEANGNSTAVVVTDIEGNGWNATAYPRYFEDVTGDGAADLVLVSQGEGYLSVSRSLYSKNLVSSLTTGLGATTSLAYNPLTDSSVYTKDTNATYPYLDLQAPIYVVSSATAPNGIGGTRSTSYKYYGAKAHLTGGGFLGFRQFDVTDDVTSIKTSTTFRQDYPYQGLPASVAVTLGGSTLKNVANTWGFDTFPDTVLPIATANGSKHHFPKPTQSVESSWDLNSTALPAVTTTNQYDAYGNATQVTVSSNDGYSKTTTNTYTNDLVNWYLGRLTRSTVTSTAP